MTAKTKNLDIYLSEIFKQFIALKDDDCKRSQEVFKCVFEQVKQKMGEQCNFFGKYASQVLYAGSVYDGIKVSKLDEYDMNIVIRLPINYDDGEDGIIIENDQPGYIKLKIIKAFDNLDKQQDWENCHKATRDWRDSQKYFLQNKFRQWFNSIVHKTLSALNGQVTVNGVVYLLTYKAAGPAYTLNVRNRDGGDHFLLDVDLVPVVRFLLPRWPKGCRMLENSQSKEWHVVPKPNKSVTDETTRNRLWRLSFQEHEKDTMKGCHHLKTTIRLVKKLRDSRDMKALASYYIKTIFLWKVHKTNDKQYWTRKLSLIFREMVEELYNAVKNKNIPYFWNKRNNLIQGVKDTVLKVYENQLKSVLDSIDANDVEKVAQALLNAEEIKQFKDSEFYKKLTISTNVIKPNSINKSIASSASSTNSTEVNSPKPEKSKDKDELLELIKTLTIKVDHLTMKMALQDDRIVRLEKEVRTLRSERGNQNIENMLLMDVECSFGKQVLKQTNCL